MIWWFPRVRALFLATDVLIISFDPLCSRFTIAGREVSGKGVEDREKAGEGDGEGEGEGLVAELPEVERLRIEVSYRGFPRGGILECCCC